MNATGAAKLHANIYNTGNWKTELQNVQLIIGMTAKTAMEYASPQNAVGTGNLPTHESGYMDIS